MPIGERKARYWEAAAAVNVSAQGGRARNLSSLPGAPCYTVCDMLSCLPPRASSSCHLLLLVSDHLFFLVSCPVPLCAPAAQPSVACRHALRAAAHCVLPCICLPACAHSTPAAGKG